MEEQAPEENSPGGAAAGGAEAVQDETRAVLSAGPGSGSRSGAFAFLALLLVIAGALHYAMADRGGGYAGRLDSELINHAELAVAAMRDENRMALVPAWPLDLYETLRRDIALYAAMAAAAAYVWSAAARARARRDAFLMHEKLSAELTDLRRRVEQAEGSASAPSSEPRKETKG